MKNFLLIVLALICISFLIIGNQYWQERIAGAPASAGADSAEKNSEIEKENFDPLISNWPGNAQEQFNQAVNDSRPFKVALVGSPALGVGEQGWSEQLKEVLMETFTRNLTVEMFESDSASVEFIDSSVYNSVLEFKPDLVLFEPFTLIDNSIGVPFERNHKSILAFHDDLKGANSGVEMILQPPYPIAGATYYPKQVEKLKEFAKENGFTYLNHWENWPEEEALKDYLEPSQEAPNEEGHDLWADYIIDYFIAD